MSKESAIFNISFIVTIICFIVITAMTLNIVFGTDEWQGKPEWKDKDHGDNHPNSNMDKNCSDSLKECAKNIDIMKFKDDDMSFKDFKHTNAWSSANDDQKECISESADLGNNLATYEVMRCYKNPEYYENR